MSERDRLLQELSEIHDQWYEEMQSQVEYKPEDSDPHDKETMESDYNIHYVDRSATPEQEQVFRDRIDGILKQLAALGDNDDPVPIDLAEKLQNASTAVEYHLATNGDAVQMLVKHDFEAGILSYREGGQWIPVKPGDELPALDDADLIQVDGSAETIWDAEEGSEMSLSDFSGVLLDEA